MLANNMSLQSIYGFKKIQVCFITGAKKFKYFQLNFQNGC